MTASFFKFAKNLFCSNYFLDQRGFTLVETLVAVFVFGLAMAAIGSSIAMIYRIQAYSMEQSLAVGEARRGVEIMAREIREARVSDGGAYPIEKGAGKEMIFYSDIDDDGSAEKVRYYLATVNSGSQADLCHSNSSGGACSVIFNDFLTGIIKSAQVKISVEGDLGASNEYVDVSADGVDLGRLCQSGCSNCAGAWQGTQTYDVTAQAQDNSIQFLADASGSVGSSCDWQNPNHSIRAQFEFIWTEEIPNMGNELRRGVIDPIGNPAMYPLDQEQTTVITSYVCNAPPIFTYYDGAGNQITDNPAILRDTKMMKLFMVINVNPQRAPYNYNLEQYVQLRNLKE